MRALKKVIVVGLDGLEPSLVEPLMQAGELPQLARLRQLGGYAPVRTTAPAQTPVAWSTFATGVNPGGHGIFDFIRRDPATYLPQLAFSRYERKSPLLPPKAVNCRGGRTIWDRLAAAGIPSVVLRCPCTYPPDKVNGRLLAGMGVPDLRGGLGTSTLYRNNGSADGSANRSGDEEEQEKNVLHVRPGVDGMLTAQLPGPLSPKDHRPVGCHLVIGPEPSRRQVTVRSPGSSAAVTIGEGDWSDWLRVKFKTGPLAAMHGMVRFYLVRLEPELELYASPVNFTPEAPAFPISSPPAYADELARRVGTFYTTGMVEDHDALKAGHLDEAAYLAQCDQAWREREAMMRYELDRLDEGFFFCLFDTPDRIQHMFWRFREPDHPANRDGCPPGFERAVEDAYRRADAAVGKALGYVDDETLLIVLSDHGFKTFRRGVHLNNWLHDRGLLALKGGVRPDEAAGDLFAQVDWSRTQAYALGLAGIYVNQQGRERHGIVPPEDVPRLKQTIARELAGLEDPANGTAVRRVAAREDEYRGQYIDGAPDLLVHFAEGYRTSWSTAMGGFGRELFEDNTARWAGDHIIDPELVPGVLLANRPLAGEDPHLVDLAPTVLEALGVPPGDDLEGKGLLP